MERYNYKEVENKWQTRWVEEEAFKAIDFSEKPKYYVKGVFRSEWKRHSLGHVICYTPTDMLLDKVVQGFNVLYLRLGCLLGCLQRIMR
jgi:leucyl-tRNA synthetase